jgi:hypothetical protein
MFMQSEDENQAAKLPRVFNSRWIDRTGEMIDACRQSPSPRIVDMTQTISRQPSSAAIDCQLSSSSQKAERCMCKALQYIFGEGWDNRGSP